MSAMADAPAPHSADPYWVELRIHGVSGTPPETMLSSAHVGQVAGEAFGRVFRPTSAVGEPVRPAPNHLLEGYHWGQFTSGSWRQGLWLLVIPFGLVNAAQFTLPRPVTAWAKVWHFTAGSLLRLIGLALTCAFTLSVALVLMDVVAWQWGATGLRTVPSNVALALGLVASAAVVGLLYSFGHRLGSTTAPDADETSGTSSAGETELARPGFYRGDADAPALRQLHTAAGLAIVALVGLDTGYELSRDTFTGAVRTGNIVLLVLLGVLVTLLGDPEGNASVSFGAAQESLRRRWRVVVKWLGWPSVAAALAILVLAAVRVLDDTRVAGARRQRLTAVDDPANVLLIVLSAALVALVIATAALAVSTRGEVVTTPYAFQRFAAGMLAAVLAAVGVFLGVGFSAAFAHGVAATLGGGAGGPLQLSPLLERLAYASGITVLVIAGLALAAAVQFVRRRREFRRRAVAAFTLGTPPGLRLPTRWLSRVAVAMWSARLKNYLEVGAWVFAALGMLISVVAAYEYFGEGDLPLALDALSNDRSTPGSGFLIGLGTWALAAMAGLLLLLGRGAIRENGVRRGVNAVWDVVAFWPRSAHPFVPPPYSQRVVMDLRDRIRFHLGTHPTTTNIYPATSVVVAAHSQGSLLAFSALLWLTPAERSRVGLVTFGSQLQVAFPRAFPAYVNVVAIRSLLVVLEGRWVNLYRDTDAIAGPVLSYDHTPDSLGVPRQSRGLGVPPAQDGDLVSDAVDPRTGRRVCGHDWRLLDPPPADLALQTGAIAGVLGHGDYPFDPDWPLALDAVRP